MDNNLLTFNCPQFASFENMTPIISSEDDVFYNGNARNSKITPNKLFNNLAQPSTLDLYITPRVKKNCSRKNFEELLQEDREKTPIKIDVLPSTSRLKLKKSIVPLKNFKNGRTMKNGLGSKSKSSIKNLKYPVTPMCLKRSFKAKSKILKSSEQMEMEKIAELQKQLSNHLRLNKISLKKLKMRPKPRTILYRNTNHEDSMENRGLPIFQIDPAA